LGGQIKAGRVLSGGFHRGCERAGGARPTGVHLRVEKGRRASKKSPNGHQDPKGKVENHRRVSFRYMKSGLRRTKKKRDEDSTQGLCWGKKRAEKTGGK